MSSLQTKIPTETWVNAAWEEYLQLVENPDYAKAKFYYNNRKLRIEMSPLGHDHACDHSIINHAIHSLLEEALRRTRESNHGKVSAWLLKYWQQEN